MLYNLFFPVKVAHHIIITALMLYMLLRRNLTSSPLFGAALMVGSTAALATLTAIDPRMASENLWHWITNLLLFLCCVQWFRDGKERALFQGHFIVGGILVITCLVESLATGERPGGVFLVINLAGAYAAALLIPALEHTIADDKPQVLPTALLVAIPVIIVINQSRGALVSAVVSLMVYLMLSRVFSTRHRLVMSLAGVGIILGGAAVFGALFPGHMAGDVERLRLWGVATTLFEQYPTGVGPGLFTQALRISSPALTNDLFTGAHNHVLTFMSELGYPGTAAGAVLLLTVVYAIPKERTNKQNASLAALVGMMVHMSFDNYPSQNWGVLVALYTAHLTYEAQWPETLPSFRWLSYPIAGVIALYGLAFIRWDHAESVYLQSIMKDDIALAREAAQLDNVGLYAFNLRQLEGDLSLPTDTNLTAYALTSYNRLYVVP